MARREMDGNLKKLGLGPTFSSFNAFTYACKKLDKTKIIITVYGQFSLIEIV